jgi:hypothetical protein
MHELNTNTKVSVIAGVAKRRPAISFEGIPRQVRNEGLRRAQGYKGHKTVTFIIGS